MNEARLPRVGCSGWNYRSWRGAFYPERMPVAEWLRYYATRFDTVEVNGTFYKLPEVSTFKTWRSQVPPSFEFAIKASRFLTHIKRLRDPDEPLKRLLGRARSLGPRLGPILYQLPPTMRIDVARLEAFLAAIHRRRADRGGSHVIEFRHPSWYVPEVFSLLERHSVTLCLHDRLGSEITEPFVGPIVYVRFHGTSGRYHGGYRRRQLDVWARRLADQCRAGRCVYAYFNNDPGAIATRNARSLRTSIHTPLPSCTFS
jgi:uncharacterized protein YecE (DUF72 family)